MPLTSCHSLGEADGSGEFGDWVSGWAGREAGAPSGGSGYGTGRPAGVKSSRMMLMAPESSLRIVIFSLSGSKLMPSAAMAGSIWMAWRDALARARQSRSKASMPTNSSA